MKVLSKGSVYALRALTYVVAHKGDIGFVNIGELSRSLDISFHFLTKIFQQLTQAGILESYQGPNGGIKLARPPQEIKVIEIVDVLEGPEFFNTCLLGLPGCGEFDPCPVHDFRSIAKAELRKEFENTTLADLGSKVTEDRLRIKP